MEYYQYFRLNGSPFQPASPQSPIYLSPTHLEGLSTLEAGLMSELTGLTMLTGEAGTGKTTLIYALLQRDYRRVRIAHIEDPKLSFLEMMQVVMTQLKLYTAGATKLDYLNALDHLLELHGADERIAIIVDEAQVATDEVLDELRLLSNRAQRNDRCLQLILVGQPELADRLKKPELRQLNQRISTRGVLQPLDLRRAAMYVEFVLSTQGSKCSEVFERHALDHLLKRSDGIPRKINMLCHTAMQSAFYNGERKVSVARAKKTAAEYIDAVAIVKPTSGSRLMPIVVTALASLLVSGVVYSKLWPNPGTHSFSGSIARTIRSASGKNRHQPASANQRGNIINAPAAPAAHPVGLQESIAPVLAASAATAAPTALNSAVTGPAAPVASRPVAAASAVGAPSQNQAETSASGDRGNQITVRYGDTLEKIALRYLGSNDRVNALIDANPGLTDINQLTVGQVIRLPGSVGIRARGSQDHSARVQPAAEDFMRQP